MKKTQRKIWKKYREKIERKRKKQKIVNKEKFFQIEIMEYLILNVKLKLR